MATFANDISGPARKCRRIGLNDLLILCQTISWCHCVTSQGDLLRQRHPQPVSLSLYFACLDGASEKQPGGLASIC